MAEVLRISPTHEPPFPSAGLRRTASQTCFFLDQSSPSQTNSSENYARRCSSSLSSSAPSSPRLASQDLLSLPSCSSTPASSLSLRDQFCLDEGDGVQPFSYFHNLGEDSLDEENSTPSNSPPRSSHQELSHYLRALDTPNPAFKSRRSAGDDLAVEEQPSRHVDYLSHEWEEDEIRSSWRHVVGKRRVLDNWERLENASWRTWAKSRGRLLTISPEALNWMKDHDVTWLYGPLQPGRVNKIGVASLGSTTRLSRMDSFVAKKSILKKRSLSEAMLQRSLSSSTLVRQAVDSIVSQGPLSARNRPILGSNAIEEASKLGKMPFSTPIQTPTRTMNSSSSSSGVHTPSERRHIHFSEKVEQCIAINKDTYYDQEGEWLDTIVVPDSDDDGASDDGILMMKAERGKERRLSSSRSGTPRPSFSSSDVGQKTIAMLPATKLRGDTPEPPEPFNSTPGLWNPRAPLTKSSSQETLKPSRPSSNFLLDEEEDLAASRQLSLPFSPEASRPPSKAKHVSTSAGSMVDEDQEMESKGLRRTPSGMFMPYDENEEDYTNPGLFGKVIDTVNTAKDIAHVIWNVGWRR